LDALPQRVKLFARQPQLARQAGRRLPLGNPSQQQHQCGRSLASFCEDGPGQQRIVALARPTTVGGKVALNPEQPPRCAAAARAVPTVWVEVPLQPHQGNAIVE